VVKANLAAYNGSSYECGNGGVPNGQNCGFIDSGNVGNSADQTIPVYYTSAHDPTTFWFKTGNSCDSSTPGERFSFIAPNGVQFSGGAGDQSALIYDQTQGLLVRLYTSGKGKNFSIGSSTCPASGTNACAQQIPSIGYCTAMRVGIDPDWGNGLHHVTINVGGNSYTYKIGGLSNAIAAIVNPFVRWNEFAAGVIPHALYGSVPCVDNSSFPFPNVGQNSLAPCSPSVTYALHPGAAIFCDYTAAQIASMHISQWAKAIVTAVCTYGDYAATTAQTSFPGGMVNGLSPIGTGGFEGPQASSFYDSNWYLGELNLLVGQGGWDSGDCGISNYAFGCIINNTDTAHARFEAFAWENIDLLQGPAGSGSIDVQGRNCGTTPCDFTGHFHEMHECKIKTMANQPGGC